MMTTRRVKAEEFVHFGVYEMRGIKEGNKIKTEMVSVTPFGVFGAGVEPHAIAEFEGNLVEIHVHFMVRGSKW